MDLKSLVDQMLQSGKELAEKGRTMAEEAVVKVQEQAQNLGLDTTNAASPTSQQPQQPTPDLTEGSGSGLAMGAAAAGVLALLLGTKGGRKVTGTAVKLGSLAAVGGLAYQMYNQWKNGATSDTGTTTTTASKADPLLLDAPAQPTDLDSETLLKVMVAAAKADGHVDQQELDTIRSKLAPYNLGDEINRVLLSELGNPLTVSDIAALAQGNEKAAVEIYLVSSMFLDSANDAENLYLTDLQKALGLPDDVVAMA